MPDTDTAHTVIDSAKRLSPERQSCRVRYSPAEMKVPPMPMAIHHT